MTHRNKNSVTSALGVNTTFGRSASTTPNDYYATPTSAVDALLSEIEFQHEIFEPCCGEGHISKHLIEKGYDVESSDLIDRGYGSQGDFLDVTECNRDIITNPPYVLATEFVQKCIELSVPKFAFLLRLQFLEGKKRRKIYDTHPPRHVLVFSGRVACGKGGNFDKVPNSAIAYSWMVWQQGYTGKPDITWI